MSPKHHAQLIAATVDVSRVDIVEAAHAIIVDGAGGIRLTPSAGEPEV